MSELKLKPTPTQTSIEDGSLRWSIEVMSGKCVMKVGVMGSHQESDGFGFGRSKTSRYYTYGPAFVGGPANDEIGKGAYLVATDDPSIFVLSRRGSLGLSDELCGPEFFISCGFEPPAI